MNKDIKMPHRTVLNVEQSALGYRWEWRCTETQRIQALAMTQQYGLPDILSQILSARNISLNEVSSFLEPKLKDLMPDPEILAGMKEAVSRIVQAIHSHEKIAVFGDYDVDGACSTALITRYLLDCGLQVLYHIPDRITEGYGPNKEAIEEFCRKGASLLICVDCGSASSDAFVNAGKNNLDILVLDHHQTGEMLPDILALVNPNRQDDLSGLGYLCATGVVFLTLVALNRKLREKNIWNANRPEPNLLACLDLVALATIADVVPLTGLNRAFIRHGLTIMRKREHPGLVALMDSARLNGPPEAWHMGYILGPRINAGGRIGDSSLGTRLLLSHDPDDAARIAERLELLNRERQAIEQISVEEAGSQADHILMQNPERWILVVSSPDWHSGIVGLIASRLRERFNRPVIAFAIQEDGTATGSGRSVPGIDIGSLIRNAVEHSYALKGGGHTMAAGVSIEANHLDRFTDYLNASVPAQFDNRENNTLLIDASLTAGGATSTLIKEIDQAGPFGSAHPEPLFVFADHRLTEVQEIGSAGHIRVELTAPDQQKVRGIAFRAASGNLGQALKQNKGRAIHAVAGLACDHWGGKERVDLRLKDISVRN